MLVFLTSLVVFGFFSLSTPIVSTITTGAHVHIIMVSPFLGFSLAIALSTLVIPKNRTTESLQLWLSGLVTLSLPLSLFFLRLLQQSMDAHMFDIIEQSQHGNIEGIYFNLPEIYNFYAAGIASIPFVLYGFFIEVSFRISKAQDIKRVYASELAGAVPGYIAALLFIDYLGLIGTTLVFLIAGLLALLIPKKKIVPLIASLVVAIVALLVQPSLFYPQRDPHLVAKDYKRFREVNILRTEWNSYAKVQLLEIKSKKKRRVVAALGGGTAHSYLPAHDHTSHSPTEVASAFKPKSVTVLFAGAGMDLVGLKERLQQDTPLTGVEINPKILKVSKEYPDSALAKVLQEPHINMVNIDARRYLETSDQKSHALLFSWSGATLAHYSGAVLHTTQYVFTTEALRSAMNHLYDDGLAIIFGGSKANTLLSAKFLEQEIPGLGPYSYALMGKKENYRPWSQGWDNNFLVIKKGSFSQAELDQVSKSPFMAGYQILASPFHLNVESFLPMQKAMLAANLEAAKDQLNQPGKDWHFTPYFDDKPFAYNASVEPHIFDWPTWHQSINRIFNAESWYFREAWVLLLLTIILGGLSYFFIKHQQVRQLEPLRHITLIMLTGLFSTGLGLLLIYRALLYVGYPNWSIVLVQIMMLSFGYIGVTQDWFAKLLKHKNAIYLVTGTLVLSVLYFLYFNQTHKLFYSIPIFTFSLVILCLGAAVSGMVFSKSLSALKGDHGIAPGLPLFINTVCAAFAALWVPLSIERSGIGFSSTQLILLFAAIVILSLLQIKKGPVKPSLSH